MNRKCYHWFLFLIVFMINQLVFSQTEKLIYGKIIVKDATVQGIHVLNLVNEKEAITNIEGAFSILAKTDDVLVFSAVHLDYMRKIIEDTDFNTEKITVVMTSKINQLDEVEVKNQSVDVVAMGILARPAKKYTPAERRLKTATALDFKPNLGAMMGGAMSLDPLLNWVSGRTKLLKSELKVEKNEIRLQKIANLYDDNFYNQKLKIPTEYTKAFQYYCIGDENFCAALQSKNKTMTTFLIGLLATEFNYLIKNENK